MFCFLHCKLQIKRTLTHRQHVMKDGGHGVITVPYVVIFSTERGKCWVWRTGRFTQGRTPFLFNRGLVGATGSVWRLWKREKLLSPTENQSTTARLSSHYPSYYTNWTTRSNTYEFISWLSRMFISCWFGIKLTAEKIFLRFYLQSTKTLRPFKLFRYSCTHS